jgi:hypothetical protein
MTLRDPNYTERPDFQVRPLRRVREGLAWTRDERFELVKGSGCWQVRSLTRDAATDLLQGGVPPECQLRRELADWLESIVEKGDTMLSEANGTGAGTMNATA